MSGSAALLCEHSPNLPDVAQRIDTAIDHTLQCYSTPDAPARDRPTLGTEQFTEPVLAALRA